MADVPVDRRRLLELPPGRNPWRSQRALPSRTLDAEERLPALEENGFRLLDVTSERITVSLFRWKPTMARRRSTRSRPSRPSPLRRPGGPDPA